MPGGTDGLGDEMKRRCRETLERAYLLMDGEIQDAGERREIRAHLEACRPCYERYGLEEEITRIVARLKGSQRCPEKLRVRIDALFRSY
jgi:mycothiol system anti-sigma-R factor